MAVKPQATTLKCTEYLTPHAFPQLFYRQRHVAFCTSEIDDIVERVYKRLRTKEQEVSVANFGSEHWGRLSAVAGLKMSPVTPLPSLGSKETPDTKFMWTEASESQQADRQASLHTAL